MGERDMTSDIDDSPLSSAGRARVFAFYGGMVVLAAIIFLVIRMAGEGLAAQVAGLEKTADGGCALIFHDIPDRLEVSRRHLPAIRQFLQDI